MKQIFASAIMLRKVVIASLTLVVSALPLKAMEIQEVVSPKGIRAWLVSDESVPIVSMRFSFKGGASQDVTGKEGTASLISALLDEGAGKLDSDAFQERFDDLGAEMGFSASDDYLAGSVRMLKDNAPEVVDLVSLAVNEPRFDKDAVERIRKQAISGLEAAERDPMTIASRKFSQVLYGAHPYGRPEEGTINSLATISPDDLKEFHRKNFARDNLLIGVVGAITPEELAPMLDKVFGDLPASAELVPVPQAQLALGATTSVTYDLPQTSISMMYPGVSRDDPDFFAAYILDHILGGGFTSRLYEEVREKRGLAYTASSSLMVRDHAAALGISTGTRADKTQETLQVLRDTVAQLAENGPTQEELDAAKSFLIGSYAVNNLTSSKSIAQTLVGLQQQKLDRDYLEQRADIINAVTLDQVKAVAKRLLEADPAILVVGPAQQ